MSNLGRQWSQPELSHTVHRGLQLGKGEEVNLNRLGTHWSTDTDVATDFTNQINLNRNSKGSLKKRVLHAEIPMSSLEFDTKRHKQHTEGYPEEKEVLVRRGAPVTLTGMTTVTKGGEKTRKFRKPKETRA